MQMAAAAWVFVKGAFAASAAGSATFAQAATVFAVKAAGYAALSAVSMALMKPNVGSRAPGEVVIDPNAGIPFAIGERIGVAGSLAYKNTYGKDTEYKGIVRILSGAGPIGGYLGFTADRETVTFSAGEAVGRYKGEWWRDTRLGAQPDTALTPKVFGAYTFPEWGSTSKLSGKACVLDTLHQDSKWSVFPQGEPDPIDVIEGIRGYDHRLDSTMPGGSGTVRLADRSTWPVISNPIIGDLNWALGLRENGKVVGGMGVSSEGVDWAAYTVAANIADMNAWKVCAYPRSDDRKSEVRAGLLQAGGAIISRRAGLVSVVSRGAAKAPVMTVSARDTAGPIELDTAANLLNRLNTITPRYLSEAHEWKLVPAAPVSSSVYVEEDRGRERGDARDYPYVSSAQQAAELAALDVAHSREGIAGRWPMKGYCRDIEPGETFTVDDPDLLMNGLEMLCLDREYDPATDIANIVFVSETSGKYPWAMGQTEAPPPTPSLDSRRDLNPPDDEAWAVIPRPPVDGVQVPAFDVSGAADNARAEAVVIQYLPVEYDGETIVPLPDEVADPDEWAALEWTGGFDGAPDLAGTAITGLNPGKSYWVRLYYRSPMDGVSRSLVKGPYTAPDLIASSSLSIGDLTAAELDAALADSRARLDRLRANLTAQTERLLAELARAKVGILSEQTVRIAELSVQVSRIDGLLARMGDAEALIVSLESVTVDLENPSSLASQLQVISSTLDTVEGDLSAQITTINETLVQQGVDLSDLAGDVVILDDGLIEAQGDIADLDAAVVAVAGQASALEVQADANTAGLTTVNQAVATDRAAGVYQAELAAAKTARGMVSVLAERLIRITDTEALATTTDALEVSVGDLDASAIALAGAVVDIEGQLQQAYFEFIAAAGGDPAHLAIKADASGSLIGLAATALILKNVVGDTVVEALKLIGGEAYFGAPVSVDISGRRLSIGPGFGASGGLILWFGPNTTALASMSRTNGYFALGTDGKVYYGSAELAGTPGGAGAKALTGSAGSTVASATVAAVVTNSLIEMRADFSALKLDADADMVGYIRFEEGTGGTWTTIADVDVTVASRGLQNPDLSWLGDSVSASAEAFGTRTGSVTYRATFVRTSGSNMSGATYQMSGSLKVTGPAA